MRGTDGAGIEGANDAAPEAAGGVEPHRYWPSYMHMGDCAICGHLADSPLHDVPDAAAPGTVPGRDLFHAAGIDLPKRRA